MIVAINKMDKPGANPDKVIADLSANEVDVEDYGGDTQTSCPYPERPAWALTSLKKQSSRWSIENLEPLGHRAQRGLGYRVTGQGLGPVPLCLCAVGR